MEHKLIQGDGMKYLPFARSRLKALRATGLSHASQKFEVDGAIIRIQVVGSEDYISIDCSVSIQMDSGVVDVHAIGVMHPEAFSPGILWETEYVKQHNAEFSLGDATDGLRRKKTNTSAGQIVGKVTKGGKFQGAVQPGGQDARSFSPRVFLDEATEPPTEKFIEDDTALLGKKLLGVLCPPSVFTGRCRLYVQSIYGRHLYEGKPGEQTPQPLPRIEASTTAAPALWIETRDKDLPPVEVKLSTSSGVHLDKTTGRHWLFTPTTGGQVIAYPLKSSKAGERLRKYLIPGGKAASELSDDDREHLEAHILAHSLPSMKGRQVVSSTIGDVYSMGYGWHWNWDGLVADAVINATFEQGGDNAAMISTHMRLTMAGALLPGGEVHWTAKQARIEENMRWAVYRTSWCFSEPDYMAFKQLKSTPKKSIVFACDAPFYAFYLRNELQVCRVRVTERKADSKYDESTGFQGKTTTGMTRGLDGGFSSQKDTGFGYYISVAVGNYESPEVPYGVTETESRVEVTGKSLGGFAPGYGHVAQYATRSTCQGMVPCMIQDERMPGAVTYVYRSTLQQDELTGWCDVVVPFYDSEACYVGASTRRSARKITNDEDYRSHLLGSKWVTKDIYTFVNGVEGSSFECIYYGVDGATASHGHQFLGESTEDVTDVTYPIKEYRLLSKGAGHAVEFGPLGEFRDNASETGPAFYTLSSAAAGGHAAIVSWPPRDLNVGMPANAVGVGVFVGWA